MSDDQPIVSPVQLTKEQVQERLALIRKGQSCRVDDLCAQAEAAVDLLAENERLKETYGVGKETCAGQPLVEPYTYFTEQLMFDGGAFGSKLIVTLRIPERGMLYKGDTIRVIWRLGWLVAHAIEALATYLENYKFNPSESSITGDDGNDPTDSRLVQQLHELLDDSVRRGRGLAFHEALKVVGYRPHVVARCYPSTADGSLDADTLPWRFWSWVKGTFPERTVVYVDSATGCWILRHHATATDYCGPTLDELLEFLQPPGAATEKPDGQPQG